MSKSSKPGTTGKRIAARPVVDRNRQRRIRDLVRKAKADIAPPVGLYLAQCAVCARAQSSSLAKNNPARSQSMATTTISNVAPVSRTPTL